MMTQKGYLYTSIKLISTSPGVTQLSWTLS